MQFTAGRKLRASELNYDTETGVDCHYRAAADQSLASGVSTILLLGTAVRTSTLVTRATTGAGHNFTVSRAGLWTMTAICRIKSGGTAGNRFLSITNQTGGFIMADNGLVVANTGVFSPLITITAYLAASDVVNVAFFTDGGSTQSTESGGDRVSFRMCWLHD